MDVAVPHRAVVPSLEGTVLLALEATTEPMTGREVATRAGASQKGVLRALGHLVAHGLVTDRPAGRARLFSLNRDHVAYAVVGALTAIRSDLLQRMRDALATWDPAPVHASLFGSAARRDGTVTSDIDVLVIRAAGVDADADAWLAQTDRFRNDITRWTGNAAHLVELDESELAAEIADPTSPLLSEIRADAVDLAGTPSRHLLRTVGMPA